MKSSLVAPLIFSFVLGAFAHAQNQEPTSSPAPNFGFTLPSVEGTLNYALSGSESFLTGYVNDDLAYTTALSGDLAYLSPSLNKPFSLVYTGGYLYTSIPGDPSSTTYQNLAMSQVVTTKNWNLVIADAFSYLPQSPTTGLSGIAGVGDIGVEPVQLGDEPAESILTNYANRVGNGLNFGVTRQITGGFSLNGSASWQVLRFLNNQGINTTEESFTAGPSYRIDARSSFGANVTYNQTTDEFEGSNFPFTSEGVTIQYQRQMSRSLSMSVALGPQRVYGTGASTTLIPSEINLIGNAGITFAGKFTNANLTYARATNSGSGVQYGSLSDTVIFDIQRQLSRNWQAAINGSYFRSSSLAQIGGFDEETHGVYSGIQLSRKINRTLFGYFSYTAITQSFNGTSTSQAVFNGLNQVFTVGLTYSPGAIHHGQP
jgi:hypothetical protein